MQTCAATEDTWSSQDLLMLKYITDWPSRNYHQKRICLSFHWTQKVSFILIMYCTLPTKSSVTHHRTHWSKEIFGFIMVTIPFEELFLVRKLKFLGWWHLKRKFWRDLDSCHTKNSALKSWRVDQNMSHLNPYEDLVSKVQYYHPYSLTFRLPDTKVAMQVRAGKDQ